MYKKAWCTCNVVALLIKPSAFLTLPSPLPVQAPVDYIWHSLNDLHLGLICRCLGTQYQIPILLSETEISEKRKVELEEDLGKLLDSKTNDAEAGNVSGWFLSYTARLDESDALVTLYFTFYRRLSLISTQPQLESNLPLTQKIHPIITVPGYNPPPPPLPCIELNSICYAVLKLIKNQ